MKKTFWPMLLGACMIVGLVGCSQPSAGSDSSAKSGAAPANSSASALSSAGETMKNIKSEGKITYALSGAYPPFSYYDTSGKLVGFDVDIADALAKQLGVKAEPLRTDFDGIVAGLKGKRFDIAVASMAITDKRLKEINFTDPYYYDGAQFYAKKGTGLKSIAELKDGKVGVCTGTTFETQLKNMSNIQQVVQFSSDVDNFMALQQGRIDGLVTSRFVGMENAKKYDAQAAGPLLYTEKIGVAVRKEDGDLLKALNDALGEIVKNGTYEKISDKWFSTNIMEH